MNEPKEWRLPPEPEGPVWDRHGDKWERTGEMLRVHGREWAEWRHVASGNLGTWPAPLMRGPVTSLPPWKPEVGGTVVTEEQYAAMPEGSIVVGTYRGNAPWLLEADAGHDYWGSVGYEAAPHRSMAGTPRTILRVGWSL